MSTRILFVIALLTAACGLQGCFENLQGSGRIVTEERKISADFSGVRVSNHGDLIVSLGDQAALTVEGDDNILPHIVTTVSGGTLVIENERALTGGWSSRKGIRYRLTVRPGQLSRLILTSHGDARVPELTGKSVEIRLSSHGDTHVSRVKGDEVSLSLSSHGDAEVDELTAGELHVRLTSHGRVRIHGGTVTAQDVELTSHGDYLAAGLRSEGCRVSNTSHGTVKVWAEKTLRARLTSHGRLDYKGDPEIEASRQSRERMHHLD